MKEERNAMPKRLDVGGVCIQARDWGGDVYHWPPGHTVRVEEDYEAVEFSPSGAMNEVIDHLKSKMQ